MLDLKTLLIMEFCTTALQAVAWLLAWRAWRQIYELKVVAAGFLAIAIGLLLLIQRGPDPALWRILTDNTVIKIGVVLLADGLTRFLGQPRCLRFGVFCLVAHFLCVGASLLLAPQALSIRIHASTIFTLALMAVMIRTLVQDRSQPAFLRWITIALLAEYMGASVLQSALVYLYPATVGNGPILSNINSWYFFQGHLFLLGFFLCLLFMVGMRLSMDLRDRNSALAREIAERRRLESELSASLDAEKAARQEQRQLMHMVSHEFRTPLAAIRYAGEMLEVMLERPQEAVAKRLRAIEDAVSRMTMLIDRFLASERQGEGLLKVEKIDTLALTEQVQSHFDLVALGWRLHFTRVESLEDYWADAEMLRTVVVNLVDNALKYSPPETKVEIALFVRNNLLIIEVSDQGIGVPAGEQSHIGRRFFRASNTRATSGSGLGLHTCQQLLNYHNGSLSLRPRGGTGTASSSETGPDAGMGTIATVRLPLSGLLPGQSWQHVETATS